MPAVTPVAAPAGLDQYWGMHDAGLQASETVEVHVKMADGETGCGPCSLASVASAGGIAGY